MKRSRPHFILFSAMMAGASTQTHAGATDAPVPETPALIYNVVTRKELTLGDHKMTLVRVRAPVLPQAPLATPPPASPPTAEERAADARLAAKAYVPLNLAATVYLAPRPVTELVWRDDAGQKEYHAWSNADFRYLSSVTQLETETAVYSWLPIITAYAPSDLSPGRLSPVPEGLDFSATDADYVVDAPAGDLASQETTLAGLDSLHAYYQLHYTELKAAYEKQQAASDALEKQLLAHPPKPPDTTLYFWPIKSRANPR